MYVLEVKELSLDDARLKKSMSRENDIRLQNVKERKVFRCIYYFCLSLLCIVLVIQLEKAIRCYLAYPTYTEFHLVRQSHADFPALSICSLSTNFKENVLQVNRFCDDIY